MNSRGLYCPTVGTSSNPTSLLQRISSIPRCMVRHGLLLPLVKLAYLTLWYSAQRS
jgi:hypothetical protein